MSPAAKVLVTVVELVLGVAAFVLLAIFIAAVATSLIGLFV